MKIVHATDKSFAHAIISKEEYQKIKERAIEGLSRLIISKFQFKKNK